MQLTTVPVLLFPGHQVQLAPTCLVVLEEGFLGSRDPFGEAFSQVVEDNAPSPSPGTHPAQLPLSFQGYAVELDDLWALPPKCPHIHAADALLVHRPVFLWDVNKSTSCCLSLDGSHLHLLQAFHLRLKLEGAWSNDVQLLHKGDEFAVEVDHHRLLLDKLDVGQDSDGQAGGLKVPDISNVIIISITVIVT